MRQECQAQGQYATDSDDILAQVQVHQLPVTAKHGCYSMASIGGEAAPFQPVGKTQTG